MLSILKVMYNIIESKFIQNITLGILLYLFLLIKPTYPFLDLFLIGQREFLLVRFVHISQTEECVEALSLVIITSMYRYSKGFI